MLRCLFALDMEEGRMWDKIVMVENDIERLNIAKLCSDD